MSHDRSQMYEDDTENPMRTRLEKSDRNMTYSWVERSHHLISTHPDQLAIHNPQKGAKM